MLEEPTYCLQISEEEEQAELSTKDPSTAPLYGKRRGKQGDDRASRRLHMGEVDTITIIDLATTVITYDPEVARAAVEAIVILTPSCFPYESEKALPWNYEAKVWNPAKTEPLANIARVGGMTRSGRCPL